MVSKLADRKLVRDGLFMKVTDLNADNEAREKLLGESPAWLQKRGERDQQEAVLRTHVVVRVLHRLRIDALDAAAGVSFKVRRTRREIEIEGS